MDLYYTAPPDPVFEEVKIAAMDLWKIVDTDNDKYGYATEKIHRIKNLPNTGDNMMYIVGMFDSGNQHVLSRMISHYANKSIRDRMLSGGTPEYFIPFKV